jgi:hypothetical protein
MFALRGVHKDGLFRAEFERLLKNKGGVKLAALAAISRKAIKLLFRVAGSADPTSPPGSGKPPGGAVRRGMPCERRRSKDRAPPRSDGAARHRPAGRGTRVEAAHCGGRPPKYNRSPGRGTAQVSEEGVSRGTTRGPDASAPPPTS